MDGAIPWGAIITGVVPSIGVALIFWVVLRGITRADRNERRAQAELDKDED